MSAQRSITFIIPHAGALLFPSMGKSCGGSERQCYLLATALHERGWQITFVLDKAWKQYAKEPCPFAITFADFSYLGGGKWRMVFCWLSLICTIWRIRSDWYVIKVYEHLLAPVRICCSLIRKKLLFWAQMDYDAFPHLRIGMSRFAACVQDWGMTRADAVVAQSRKQQKGFQDNFTIAAHYIPSIYAAITSSQHIQPKQVDVLWVGNSFVKKRYELLYEIARALPTYTFAVAMNISDHERFQKAECEARDIPNITFLGMIPSATADAWFACTKLFINTSTYEGFPNTFLQAWAQSIPVISAGIDPDNIIQERDLGRVAERGSVDDLVGHIEELLADDALRTALGARGRAYVQESHATSLIANQFEQVLSHG